MKVSGFMRMGNMDNGNVGIQLIINGISYIGEPESHTVMYISRKVEYLLEKLKGIEGSLIFIENGIIVPEEFTKKNQFIFSDNPQREYAEYILSFAQKKWEEDRRREYKLTKEGYYIGENVVIGENAFIEPNCLISHDVIIGKNAYLKSGVKIRNTIIGDDFIANENAVIGANGFTMATDKGGNKFRIPTLGKVIIGNCVEVGALDNISAGTSGNTIIEDNVKLDALVHIGHDAQIRKNTEITAGAVIGGFSIIGEEVFIGVNSTIRNRIELEDSCFIGMGSNVINCVKTNEVVAGNPAKFIREK